MSYEIILIAGAANTPAQQRRRRLVEHAAAIVPGAVGWERFENEHATIALVATSPAGGSGGLIQEHDRAGATIVIGASAEATDAASRGVANSESGAEHGHVKVVLIPDGTVELSTDGTGIIPSFWSATIDELRFATHLGSLVSLGTDPTIDQVGTIEYLVMLQCLGDRTVLRDAKLLPAGGCLRFISGRGSKLSVKRLYTPSHDSMSDDEAVRAFAGVWSALTGDMLERSAAQRMAFGLSGGLDSRAIAVECVRLGGRPHAFTYGSSATRPARVAIEIARLLQLDHTLLPVTDDRLMTSPVEKALLLDGAHSPAEMYELWFAPTLRQLADVVVNGHGGGPLWGDEKALGIPDRGSLLGALGRRFRPEAQALVKYLDPEAACSVSETLRTSLTDSLEEWDIDSRPDMVSFWNVHNRQFRWGHMVSTALRRSGLRLEAPFMDSRFLHFSARLSPEQRMNGTLYLRAHRELFAETARVPRSDDGNTPSRLNHLYMSGDRSYTRQFADIAAKHPLSAARRVFGRAQDGLAHHLEGIHAFSSLANAHTSRRSVFTADVWLRSNHGYRERLLEFLTSAPAAPLISSTAVDRAVDELRRGTARGGALRLARIATLQVWNQDFLQRADAFRSAESASG